MEAKIGGVPAVVSDHNFNGQIVNHEQDGLVLRDITADKLADALMTLDSDRERLWNMKKASRTLSI